MDVDLHVRIQCYIFDLKAHTLHVIVTRSQGRMKNKRVYYFVYKFIIDHFADTRREDIGGDLVF